MKLKSLNKSYCLNICLAALFIISCNSVDTNQKSKSYTDTGSTKKGTFQGDLPFVGIRHFETRDGVSGRGTPFWLVQIKENGDVIFYYTVDNSWHADGDDDDMLIAAGKYDAGKFKKYIKCLFKECQDFPRYYEITKENIYEVDSNYHRLFLTDCIHYEGNDKDSSCQGELYSDDSEGGDFKSLIHDVEIKLDKDRNNSKTNNK